MARAWLGGEVPAPPGGHEGPASYYAARPEGVLPQPLAGPAPAFGSGTSGLCEDVEAYIALRHVGKWHDTLNHHASTRPKMHGGPLVRSVTACKWFLRESAPGSASAPWCCTLQLPNSFAPNDGLEVVAVGKGASRDEASEHACRQVIAQLLLRDPSRVVLRPKQWKVAPDELLAGMPGASGAPQALPVHIRARGAGGAAGGAGGAALSLADKDAQVADVVRACLRKYGGRFNPSHIPGNFFLQFDRLLLPGELRPFVERHPEFASAPLPDGRKGYVITWASGAAPSSASASRGREGQNKNELLNNMPGLSSSSAAERPEGAEGEAGGRGINNRRQGRNKIVAPSSASAAGKDGGVECEGGAEGRENVDRVRVIEM